MSIVVFGGANMDLVVRAPRLPLPGESLPGDEFYTAPGGKGGCQAVAVARMGIASVLVGRVGRDRFGEELIASLRESGVDTSGILVDDDASSGVAVISIDGDAQNSIIVVTGATGRLDDTDVNRLDAFLAHASVLMLQLEAPLAASLAAARRARERGVFTILDPAPAQPLPAELYALPDLITPNEVEASQLLGWPVRDEADAKRAVRELITRGAGAAVVKLGAKGAAWGRAAADVVTGFQPAFTVKAVDTVAAGDAFNAGIAVAITAGRTLPEAVRYGAAMGALAASKPGAQPSMPTRAEVERFLAGRGPT